ncbi:hypothetical protein [uncultured Granulicatella sp.]|uniref:hypothetical protein n=1 Tax=uncultured Granulicatella sp. TaxID=316089 RepID=UPI002626D86D|nr:hypothetical protein [uncultured Granulicatella sp.]
MKGLIKKYIVYIVIAMMYYLIPLYLVKDIGSGIFLLLTAIPTIVFLISLIYAKKNGFKWYFSVIVGLLWFPNVFILNDSASSYTMVYGAISFIGQLIGNLLRKYRKSI